MSSSDQQQYINNAPTTPGNSTAQKFSTQPQQQRGGRVSRRRSRRMKQKMWKQYGRRSTQSRQRQSQSRRQRQRQRQ